MSQQANEQQKERKPSRTEANTRILAVRSRQKHQRGADAFRAQVIKSDDGHLYTRHARKGN